MRQKGYKGIIILAGVLVAGMSFLYIFTSKRINKPTNYIQTSTPTNINHTTDWGYQNNEAKISLRYPKSWSASENNYIGQAKSLSLKNKELDITISIIYLKKGMEGQTGPTGLGGNLIRNGSYTIAGKTINRYYEIYKDEKGVDTIEAVFYTDPASDKSLEFYLDDLQLTISIGRYMDENYKVGQPLTVERIQKAEQVLSTFKLAD